MKLTRVLSLMLVVVLTACALVSCGGRNESEVTTVTTLPMKQATVDLQVVDADGNVVVESKAYKFTSSTLDPTPNNVLDDYCYMNDITIKVDEYGTLVTVGKVSAKDGESYWSTAVNGKVVDYSEAAVKDGDVIVITLTKLS